MKKVFKKITVQTVQNGYSLSIEGDEFFYFSEIDLLAGFLAHVGTGKTTDMENGDLINSLFNMMLGQKYANDVDRLKMTVNRLEARYTDVTAKFGRELDKVKEANEKHEKMKKLLEETTKLVTDMRLGYQEACKPYEEYNNRINTLESKTTSMESHFNAATAESQMLLKLIRDKYHELLDLTNKLSSRGDMMIGRMINQVNKNAANMAEQKSGDEGGSDAEFQPAADATGTVAEKPAGYAVVAETDAKPKRKGGRPKKSDGDKPAKKPRAKKADADKKAKPKAETPRQKRDREILEKMMEDNPNIK